MNTQTEINLYPTINVNNVECVYSGIDGRCCCGCAGKYSYAKAHQQTGSKNRGYSVDDDEVSDRSVKMIVNKMNKHAESLEWNEHYVALVLGNRLYMARFPK